MREFNNHDIVDFVSTPGARLNKRPTSFSIVGELKEPDPVEEYDPNFAMMVRYHSGQPRFVLSIKPSSDAPFVVEGEVEYMVCNDKTCLPPMTVPFRITVPAT